MKIITIKRNTADGLFAKPSKNEKAAGTPRPEIVYSYYGSYRAAGGRAAQFAAALLARAPDACFTKEIPYIMDKT